MGDGWPTETTMHYAITTLGCKVNQYESGALAATLRSAGLQPARRGRRADLVVVNTCCVTRTAMRKSRQAIRRAVRASPGAAVLVVGCYGDYDAARIKRLLDSASVTPSPAIITGHHGDVAACVEEITRMLPGTNADCNIQPHGRPIVRVGAFGNDVSIKANHLPCDSAPGTTSIRTLRKAAVKSGAPGTDNLSPVERFENHQRAFVKVQDGCDAFCAYCVVPYTRPRVRSRNRQDVLAECRRLVARGHREVVLCGVYLGAYGRRTAIRRRFGPAPAPLAALLREVAAIDGLWRVRLSSIEPGDVTDELLEVFREMPTVAPHFHLPLQSGSDRILRRMNRQYTADEFRRTIDRVKESLPGPAVTGDVIVGFPGEGERDFAATLSVCRHAGFAKIHAFPFSPMEGTAAFAYRHEAPPARVVKERMERLGEAERELARAYRRRFIGATMEGLVEGARGGVNGMRRAMTDRYLPVRFHCEAPDLTGRVVRLMIESVGEDGLLGRFVESVGGVRLQSPSP